MMVTATAAFYLIVSVVAGNAPMAHFVHPNAYSSEAACKAAGEKILPIAAGGIQPIYGCVQGENLAGFVGQYVPADKMPKWVPVPEKDNI